MNCCSKYGIHEHSPNNQIHIQIIHRIVKLFPIDLPDHGEDGFQKMRCVRWYLEVVVPCCFRILFTLMVIWRTSCVCKELHPNFIVLTTGSPLFYLVSTAGLSETSESFFLMRRVSPLLFHQPAKVCILQSHLRNKSTLLRMCLIYHSSYCRVLRNNRHPQTLIGHRPWCDGRTRRIKKKILLSLLVATWTQLFLFFFVSYVSSSSLWSSLSNWNSVCIEKLLFPLVKISVNWWLVSM